MALQYEEDISPSLMLQERKGNPINSQEKEISSWYLSCKKRVGWQKGTKKLGRFLGWFFGRKRSFAWMRTQKNVCHQRTENWPLKKNLCQNTKMQWTLFHQFLSY